MGNRFISDGMVENGSASIDSSMLKADGPVWHKLDMEKNRLPIAGIDIDAKWGYSKSKGWMFGYKLHKSCSTGKLIVPLSAYVSTANVHDGNMYCTLVDPLAGLVENVLCDPAYDNSKLYQFSNKKNLRLITPIKQYPRTPPERIKLAEFYNSNEGQELYRNRKVSIEQRYLRHSRIFSTLEQFL